MKNYKNLIALFVVVIGLLSCEQERLDPVLTTAEGGGELNDFVAYTIASQDPDNTNVYGRIVFYKTTIDQTLVQISLYNTDETLTYSAIVLDGVVGSEATSILTLDNVDGATGEFKENKFYVITDTSYYDSISELNAHVSIYLSTDDSIVASGNIGTNAEPIESN